MKAADREKGRFRSFLLVCVKRFLANEHDRATALKRGGGAKTISIDFVTEEGNYVFEPACPTTPEKLYVKQWALTLLDQVLRALRDEYRRDGKESLFEALKGCLTTDVGHVPYRDIAQAVGMSEGAVKVAAHRMRKRYQALLRAEIGMTLSDPAEMEDELRDLLSALGQ